jgi:hypothetical protein
VRRVATALAVLGVIAVFVAPADAKKRHHRHKPSGITGVVLDSSCAGPCAEPPPPQPVYTGPVTVTVARASDGVTVASQAIDDGHFRFRVKRGTYNVSSVPPNPSPQPCPPGQVCPLEGTQSPAVIAQCMQGETQQVLVRRHHFTPVDLHVSNVCIV